MNRLWPHHGDTSSNGVKDGQRSPRHRCLHQRIRPGEVIVGTRFAANTILPRIGGPANPGTRAIAHDEAMRNRSA